ncbi:hypothetical protein QE152_g33120 [Popillia japonica]|uniref:Uncharacterized protein n=1 Tax=Popillia japonica TaxID=7064 RepID=A0AAW1IXI5_POPJA
MMTACFVVRALRGPQPAEQTFSAILNTKPEMNLQLRHGSASEWIRHAIGPLHSDVITLIVNTHMPNILQDYNACRNMR